MNYLHRKRLAIMKSQTMKGVIRTVSGYPLTLTDCMGSRLVDYKIYGNTVDGKGVGDYDSESGKYKIPVTVSGINLSDISNWNFSASASNYIKSVDGKLYVRGGPVNINSSINIVQFFKTLKPNTTYTILCDVPSGATGISQIRAYVDNTEVFRTYAGTGVGVFTTPNRETLDEITKMYFYGGNTDTNYVENFMVVEGSYTSSTRPEYEPYHEPVTTNIYLDEPVAVNESVDYGTAKVSIPVYIGTNIITVETTVSPSNMEVSYYSDVEDINNGEII